MLQPRKGDEQVLARAALVVRGGLVRAVYNPCTQVTPESPDV